MASEPQPSERIPNITKGGDSNKRGTESDQLNSGISNLKKKAVEEAASGAAASATGGATKAVPVVDKAIKNTAGRTYGYVKKNKGKIALALALLISIPLFIFFSIITNPMQMGKLAIRYGYKVAIPSAKVVVKLAIGQIVSDGDSNSSLAINSSSTSSGLQAKIDRIDWSKIKDPSPDSKSECNFSTKEINGISKIDKLLENGKPINMNNLNPDCVIDGFETNIPLVNKAFISPDGKFVASKNRTSRSGALSKEQIEGLSSKAIENKVKEDNDKKVRVKPKTKSNWTDDCVDKMINDYNFSKYQEFKNISCDIDQNQDQKKISRELFCSYVDNYLDDKKSLSNKKASDAASVRLFTRTLNKAHAQKAKFNNISLQEIGIMSKSNAGFNSSEEYYLLQGQENEGVATKAEQTSGSAIGLKEIDNASILDSQDEIDKAINACASLSKADSRKGIFGSITNFFNGGTGAVTVDNFIKKLPEKLVVRVSEYKRGDKYIVNQDIINKISRQLSGTFITNEEGGEDKFNVIMQGSRSTFDQLITLRGGRYLNDTETQELAMENAQLELYKDQSKGMAYRMINTNNTRSLISLAMHRSFTRIDNIPKQSGGILLAMIKPNNIFEWSNKIAFNYIGGTSNSALAISIPSGSDSFGFDKKELEFDMNTVIASVESKESSNKYQDLYAKLLECSKMSRVEILENINKPDFECKNYHNTKDPNYRDILEWRQYKLIEATVNDLVNLSDSQDDYNTVDDSIDVKPNQVNNE
jgi:hypothetical protein